MTAKIVDGVMRAVRDLLNSGPNYDGRWADVERTVWDALDAAVAAERERCATLVHEIWYAIEVVHGNRAGQYHEGRIAALEEAERLIRKTPNVPVQRVP